MWTKQTPSVRTTVESSVTICRLRGHLLRRRGHERAHKCHQQLHGRHRGDVTTSRLSRGAFVVDRLNAPHSRATHCVLVLRRRFTSLATEWYVATGGRVRLWYLIFSNALAFVGCCRLGLYLLEQAEEERQVSNKVSQGGKLPVVRTSRWWMIKQYSDLDNSCPVAFPLGMEARLVFRRSQL